MRTTFKGSKGSGVPRRRGIGPKPTQAYVQLTSGKASVGRAPVDKNVGVILSVPENAAVDSVGKLRTQAVVA